MASFPIEGLKELLIKYAGVPPKEATLLVGDFDEVRSYATEVALLADLAGVPAGAMAYAIDTGAMFLRGTSAFVSIASPASDADSYLRAQVTIAAADIKLMKSAPPTIVTGVAAKMIVSHDLTLQLDAGSEVLTGDTNDLDLRYIDETGIQAIAAIDMSGFIGSATDRYLVAKGDAIAGADPAEVVGTDLVLANIGAGEFAGNASDDADLIATLRYSLVDAF